MEDEIEAEYWGRQIRLGGWIAVGVTLLGCLRVLADWAPGQRWWALPILGAALVQAALLVLPWARLVRRPHVREALIIWWVLEVPIVFAFAVADDAGAVLYPLGAILVVTTAAALYPPAWIVALGAFAVAGFVALPAQGSSTVTLLIGVSAMLATMVGLNAATAALRRGQSARRRAAERRTELLLAAASDAVLAIGAGGEVRYASPSTRTLLGLDPQRLTGERLAAMLHPDDLPQAREWLAALTGGPARHTGRLEVRLRRADGDWIYVDVIGANQTADPDLRAAVLSLRDIGARRALEDELARQAFSDSLTGLANRALFRDRVAHAVARNQRGNGRVTVLLIDLDDFKTVNDTWGHSAGDRLLTTVAERLRRQVRPSDTLARLGGDEFAVLVEDVDDVAVADMAERILQAVRVPVPIGARHAVCTMSIGIATVKSTDGETDTEELMRDADLAMYAAKKAGRDRYVTYDPAMYTDVLREAQQRADLEQALVEGQFIVHYQPIVDLPGRQLTGVEALVRWQHPRDGLVGPDRFIPQAEETGLIVPLGRWVLRQACAQLADWQRERPAARSLRMSVNISARQFLYAGLVADVAEVLATSGIAPSALILEITESMLMRDTDATIATLHELRALGVRLAIDDFGTGYSSLSYLKQFPVDILKIDRAFVDGVHDDPDDATLAEAVVGIGRALRLQTVAEGIETTDQWAALRTLGCDLGQGFLFARPVAAADIARLLDGDGESLRA